MPSQAGASHLLPGCLPSYTWPPQLCARTHSSAQTIPSLLPIFLFLNLSGFPIRYNSTSHSIPIHLESSSPKKPGSECFIRHSHEAVWWHRPVIPDIWRLKQKAYKFKVSLGKLVRTCLKIVKVGWESPSMAKCLPSTHKAPGLIPQTAN